jgi:phage tail sheath gpL-like
MTLPAPSGYTPSLTPVTAIAVRLGVGAVASPTSTLKAVALGNKTVAGSVAAATPVRIPSAEDAATLFGARSEVAAMARAWFRKAPRGLLYGVAVAENGGAVAATATILFAGPATGAGVIRGRVAGQLISEVAVASGASANTVAAALEAELDRWAEMPATAGVSTATVTLTAANGGPRGNNLRVVLECTAPGITMALNGGSAAAVVKGNFGAGTATAGSAADDFTAALAAIQNTRYHRIIAACDDDTNRGLVKTHLNTVSGINAGRRAMAICGSVEATVATAQGDGTGHQEPRLTIVYGRKSPRTPAEIAANYAAARIYGDGTRQGEVQYRAAKQNGLQLDIEETENEDLLSDNDVAACLAAGVTPLVPDPLNPGYMRVVRPVTTRTTNVAGSTSYRVLDPAKVGVADEVADRIEAFAAVAYATKNLVPEPDPDARVNGDVIWPSAVREDILAILRAMEGEGLLVRVNELADQVQVEPMTGDDSFLIATVPIDVIEHFHGFLVEVLQQG